MGTWSWSGRDGLHLEGGKTALFPDCPPANQAGGTTVAGMAGIQATSQGGKARQNALDPLDGNDPQWPASFHRVPGYYLGWDAGGHPAAAVGVFHDLTEVRESQATKAELARQTEKLRGLQSQLNPHFLFNSLNTVRALIGDDPEAARASVTALASILRATLKFEPRSKIPLREELQVIRHFLRLQGLRHGARLRSRIRVTRAAAMCPVPPLIVLNMVENATIHGIEKTLGGGRYRRVMPYGRSFSPNPGEKSGRVQPGLRWHWCRKRAPTPGNPLRPGGLFRSVRHQRWSGPGHRPPPCFSRL